MRARDAVMLLALGGCTSNPVDEVVCPEGSCDPVDAGRRDVPTGRDVRLPPTDFGPGRTLTRLGFRPEAITLEDNGETRASAEVELVGFFSDGTSGPVPAAVLALAPNLAVEFDPARLRLATTGRGGGIFPLTAQVTVGGRTLEARALVEVRLTRTTFAMGTPPDSAARFATAPVDDATRAANVLYPLDGAVIPNNLRAPEVQWERGDAGDVFRLRVSRPHVEQQRYVIHSGMGFRFAEALDAEGWRALLESDPDDPIAIRVDRFDAARGQVVPGTTLRLRVARAALTGSIYYWDLTGGRILKIDAITGERSVAVPSPPPRPNDPNRGSRCIACHTVSRDGRYMSVEMWGGGLEGAAFDLTASDLRNDPAPTVYGPRADLTYLFSTFSPDNRYVLINPGSSLGLIRREGGAPVPDTGLPTMRSAHPSWSPDGREVAFIANHNGTWAVDFTAGDLAVLPRTGETTFGPPRILHLGASTPGGTVDAHPSWSPDSRIIAFQHGVNSRGARERMAYPGRLLALPRDAAPGTAPVALMNANGPGEPSSFWPNFSPFNQGGYYWLAFYSRRDYGNAQAGTRGTGRRQIWVTAVRNDAPPGADPSSVPYWLPGQDRTEENMSAYWSPTPCRPTGEGCRVSAECCTGNCAMGGNGELSCQPPPPKQCRRVGNTCSRDADCCEGLQCVANVCGAPPG